MPRAPQLITLPLREIAGGQGGPGGPRIEVADDGVGRASVTALEPCHLIDLWRSLLTFNQVMLHNPNQLVACFIMFLEYVFNVCAIHLYHLYTSLYFSFGGLFLGALHIIACCF